MANESNIEVNVHIHSQYWGLGGGHFEFQYGSYSEMQNGHHHSCQNKHLHKIQ